MTTDIQTHCPNCQLLVKIKPQYLGREVFCMQCGCSFRISSHVQLSCPNCRRDLKINPKLIGRQCKCKRCHHKFLAQPEGDRLMSSAYLLEKPAPVGAVEEADSESWSGSRADSPCSCRAILQSAPVTLLQSLQVLRVELEATQDVLARGLEEARSHWEAERQAMGERWVQEREDLIQEAKRQRGEEQARVEAEQQRWQEWLEEARRQIDQARAMHQDETVRLGHELDTLRQERAQWTTARDELQEAERRHQAEAARLNQALEEVQRHAESWAQRSEALDRQLQELHAQIHQQRQDLEAERQERERPLAALQLELTTVRAELQRVSAATGVGPEPVPDPSRSPATPTPALPAQDVGLYSDIALSNYDASKGCDRVHAKDFERHVT